MKLVLHFILGHVGSIVPSVVLCRVVNLREVLLAGPDASRGITRRIAGHIAEEDGGILDCRVSVCFCFVVIYLGKEKHTEFSELPVGDDQRAQGAEAVKGLVSVLLRLLLADRSAGGRYRLGVELLGLPDEVLKQVAVILGQQQMLGLFHDFFDVGNQIPSLG